MTRRRPRARAKGGIGLVVAGFLLAGCGLTSTPRATAPALALSIATADGAAGLTRVASGLSLYSIALDGSAGLLTTAQDLAASPLTVHLYSLGGETRLEINSYVFGHAPHAARSVVVQPGDVRAIVQGDLYLAPLQAQDVTPTELTWTFLDVSGHSIASGSGIRD